MKCSDELVEVDRSVEIYGSKVVKKLTYQGDPKKVAQILSAVSSKFMSLPQAMELTPITALIVKPTHLIVEQRKLPSRPEFDRSAFDRFVERVVRSNDCGWVFGDLNAKNVMFDGQDYRVIDFEPFTKICRLGRAEFRVTHPYFHPVDRANGIVTCFTDRLGIIGLLLRLRFGFRRQREIFTVHAPDLHWIASLVGGQFLTELAMIEDRYL